MWDSQSQETVGQSEPMTASAVRARASLVYDCEQYLWEVEGRAENQSAPSWSHQQKPGKAMLSHNKYTGQRLWSMPIPLCAEGSEESSLPLPRVFRYLFRWRAGTFLC